METVTDWLLIVDTFSLPLTVCILVEGTAGGGICLPIILTDESLPRLYILTAFTARILKKTKIKS